MAALDRFVAAQDAVWPDVIAELSAGRKQSHWMWFVFPQCQALGRSQMARHYGIVSLAEARAYLAHAVLGARLRRCTQLVLAVQERSAHAIFGSPDDLKFCSCMTLFGAASTALERVLFDEAMARYCGGIADAQTLAILAADPSV